MCPHCSLNRASCSDLTSITHHSPSPPLNNVCRKTGIGYDERMKEHNDEDITSMHPERPDRIAAIWNHLNVSGVVSKCSIIKSVEVSDEDVSIRQYLNLFDIY
jgi:hypothetical protein